MKRRTLGLVMTVAAATWLCGAAGCEDEKPDKCGNGVQDLGETCDGSSVGNQTCQGLGYAGGTLGCNATCNGYDTSSCLQSICGNGEKEPTEVCDGSDFGGNSCTTLAMGFVGGTLGCQQDCLAFDTSDCILPDLGGVAGTVSLDTASVTCDATLLSIDCAGPLYVAIFDQDPELFPNRQPMASTVIEDADLAGDASTVPYALADVPVGTWYLTAFLDDDDNAAFTAERPDSGDPVVTPFQVTVTIDATTTQNITLDLRLP